MYLLVVDDASVHEALALVLGLDGFEVTTAGDGREAMRTLSLGRPDAVIPPCAPRGSRPRRPCAAREGGASRGERSC
jgi:hypothetical protein